MKTTKKQVISAKEIAREGILLVTRGQIRNHKLGNSARIHTGEVEKKNVRTTEISCRGKTAVWCMD